MRTRCITLIMFLALLIIAVIPSCKSSKDSSIMPYLALSSGMEPLDEVPAVDELGSIQYTLDTSRQDSDTYDSLSTSYFILIATDAKGYRWMLSVPPGALLTSQTITMTPFATIDLSQSGSGIKSGVRLEPDGLQFLDTVRLFVTPPKPISPKGVGLVFNLNQDGSNVAFAPTINFPDGSGAYGEIWHFSAAAYAQTNNPDVKDLYIKWARENYTMAVGVAKMLLSQWRTMGPPTPPTPPAISQFCRCSSVNPDNGEHMQFAKEFYAPYANVVSMLFAAIKDLELMTADDTSDGYELGRGVMETAVQSAVNLGDAYRTENPPDRLYAIIAAGLYVDRMFALFGGSPSPNPNWLTLASYLRDYYFGELKYKHDYRVYPQILRLSREVGFLGGEDRLQDIMNALTFDVVVNTSFSGTWIGIGGPAIIGSVKQNAHLYSLTNTLTPPSFLWGTADNMTLTTESGSYIDSIGSGSVPNLTGQTDTATVWLNNFDPCENESFDVVITGFEGSNETTTIASPAAYNSLSAYQILLPYSYTLTVPIVNQQVDLGTTTASGSGSTNDGSFDGSAEISVWLVHKPM